MGILLNYIVYKLMYIVMLENQLCNVSIAIYSYRCSIKLFLFVCNYLMQYDIIKMC